MFFICLPRPFLLTPPTPPLSEHPQQNENFILNKNIIININIMIERYVKDLFYLFVYLFGLKWNEFIEMK